MLGRGVEGLSVVWKEEVYTLSLRGLCRLQTQTGRNVRAEPVWQEASLQPMREEGAQGEEQNKETEGARDLAPDEKLPPRILTGSERNPKRVQGDFRPLDMRAR